MQDKKRRYTSIKPTRVSSSGACRTVDDLECRPLEDRREEQPVIESARLDLTVDTGMAASWCRLRRQIPPVGEHGRHRRRAEYLFRRRIWGFFSSGTGWKWEGRATIFICIDDGPIRFNPHLPNTPTIGRLFLDSCLMTCHYTIGLFTSAFISVCIDHCENRVRRSAAMIRGAGARVGRVGARVMGRGRMTWGRWHRLLLGKSKTWLSKNKFIVFLA